MSKLRGLWAGGMAFVAVLFTLPFAVACNETRDTGAVTTRTNEGTSTTPPAEVAEKRDVAMVRAVNAIPGGDVNIWAGDSVAFSGVGYKSTTAWRQIPDNMFNFQIRRGGAGSESLAENRENLQDGGHYTIIALPDEGGADKRNLRVLDDDLKPIAGDKARIRFVNGVPSDTDVDLYLRGREDALFDGVNFKSEAGWTDVAPVSGTLVVRPDNRNTVLARLANVKLEGGKSYTFILTGRAGKYDLIKIEDTVARDTGTDWKPNS